VSGRFVSLCDASSVQLACGDKLTLTLTWTAQLSDFPISDLPDLQDIGEHVGRNASHMSF